jgi:ubiquinone/menaquinone biosynthesis C-methylase UbiE
MLVARVAYPLLALASILELTALYSFGGMSLSRIRGKLSGIYWWLEKRIDARTRSSQYLYAAALRSRVRLGHRWLDVGCGRQILPDWILDQTDLVAAAKLTVGLDYTTDSLKGNRQLSHLVVGDIESVPFAAESFDIVSANMVVEHIEKPIEALREIYRILRPGGCFVYHTANSKFYITFVASLLPQSVKNRIIRVAEGRKEEDVFPTRYMMNSLKAIYKAAEAPGFRVTECHCVNSSSTSEMIFGPFVILTLIIRRLLQWNCLQQFRSNFVVVLEKASGGIRE